jgi:predicted RNA-binding Zn ribbon-like protein
MAAQKKLSPVPWELARLNEFVKSLDLRRFVQGGAPHLAGDAFASMAALEAWMAGQGLLEIDVRLSRGDHEKATTLRNALRSFLRLAPPDRRADADTARLNAAAATLPLIVEITEGDGIRLQPYRRDALSGLGTILADLHHAAEIGSLDRLKMCASEECQWVFFDRSKPATRRWCSSALCGNREKTRAYRTRHRVKH